MSDKAKQALDRFFTACLGTEQRRAAERVRDDYAADEETAGLFNRMLDEIEAKLAGETKLDGTAK